MRVASAIELPIETRRRLEKQARGRSTPVRVAQRSRIVLLAADSIKSNLEACYSVGMETSFHQQSRCSAHHFSSGDKDSRPHWSGDIVG